LSFYHGLECLKELLRGVCSPSKDVTAAKCQSNQAVREFLVGRGGGLGTLSCTMARMMEAQLVFLQFGDRGDGHSREADKEINIGTWSDPVLGKWVDHDEKQGANALLTNERSSTAGLSSATNGKWVKAPGMLRREQPKSAALAK